MESFDDLPKEQILSLLSTYHLEPFGLESEDTRKGHMEFRVFKFLNGPDKGEFMARPFMGFSYGEEQFTGHGDTEERAVLNLLDRVRGIPFETIFSSPD